MENAILIEIYIFSLMKVVEEDMTRNCSRKASGLMLDSMLL